MAKYTIQVAIPTEITIDEIGDDIAIEILELTQEEVNETLKFVYSTAYPKLKEMEMDDKSSIKLPEKELTH